MILVTGAGGTVGSEVVNELQSANAPFRAGYFSKGKAESATARGIDAIIIDFNHPETVRAALQGIDKLFLVAPSVLNQTQLELNVVEAARALGVRHIVKLSVWRADEEAFVFAKVHRPVEKAIMSSGIAWTFLRPNGFMQDIVTFMGDTIRSEGVFYSATDGARISHVDVRDIAAVAGKALTESGHEGKVYTLSGPVALTYTEMALDLSKVLGRQISHINLSPSDLKSGMLAAGVPEEYADWLLDLERYYREAQASRITNDIQLVTGRAPRRFAQYARDCASLLQQTQAAS